MKIDVLDKGYIEVVDTLGDDLTPVNAARVSFGGRSDKFTDKDKRLSKFLIKHKHFSPFRHQHIQIIIKAPEFVMRQWYKHVVGIETTSSHVLKTMLGMRLVVVMFLMMSSMNQKSFVNNRKTINKLVMV